MTRLLVPPMPKEINWDRSEYESRVDIAAEEIETFVDAVLNTIDVESARSSPTRWEIVCRYFAGSARAARAQQYRRPRVQRRQRQRQTRCGRKRPGPVAGLSRP